MDGLTNSYKSGIPMPIVTFNRAFLTITMLIAIITGQIWITSIVFLILLPVTLFGRKFSLIYYTAHFFLKNQIIDAELEDASLQRFNNTIATSLLGFAQIAFAVSQPVLGWIFAGMVALASGVALAGFCVGCYLYYQFKLQRYRLFKSQ
jgi:hypothetical protein